MKKVLKIVRNVIYIIFVASLLLLIIVQILPVDKSIKYFGFRPLVTTSGSMKGKIDVLDVIVIKRTAVEKLEVGDIITFYPPQEALNEDSFAYGELFTHYVASIEKKDDGWEIHTKSNISKQWDDWILTEENLIGERWFVIPKIGFVILAFKNPMVLRNFIVLVILVIAIVWIWPRKDKSETDDEAANDESDDKTEQNETDKCKEDELVEADEYYKAASADAGVVADKATTSSGEDDAASLENNREQKG